MGIPSESTLIRLKNREGIALASAIFGMVVVSLITVGVFAITDLDAKATRNRAGAATALGLAHTAETHALSILRTRLRDTTFNRLLRGFDNLPLTADDGLITGYPGLGDSLDVPVGGRATLGGTYFVKLFDDPAETDGLPLVDANRRLRVNCRGVTPDGSSAEVNVIVSNFSLPGLAVDGNLEISGKLNLQGGCGGIHANGNISGGGQPTVSTVASATGSVTVNVTPKISGAAPIEIPDLNPVDFCGSASYVYISTGSPNFSSGTWKPKSSSLVNGKTYCVNGNVEFDEDVGTSILYRTASVIAMGSIKNSKQTFLKAAHPDGIVMMANGDMDIQGDGGFQGILYAGAQCYVSSKPTITGQFICKNKSPHAGANYVPFNLISGDADITFGCVSMLSNSWRVVSWYQTIGS